MGLDPAAELLALPAELSRVDALLDDTAFFAPFAPNFDARIGRPSIPMETYLRLLLKFRYRLGYESLCREVADLDLLAAVLPHPLGTRVPHTTSMSSDGRTEPSLERCQRISASKRRVRPLSSSTTG